MEGQLHLLKKMITFVKNVMKITREEKEYTVDFIEHMVHKDNLNSILEKGVLSHNRAVKEGVVSEDISMPEVQRRRNNKSIRVGDKIFKLHDFANFYWNTRNPMLYKRKSIQRELFILLFDVYIFRKQFHLYTDGNAASRATKFFMNEKYLTHLPWEVIKSGSWNDDDESIKRKKKRMMCAEMLIHDKADISWLRKIITPTDSMSAIAEELLMAKGIKNVEVEKKTGYYFYL